MDNPRSRSSAADGRIIITGTGRTGTTFLVQLFTALGFDTGFTVEEALGEVDEISKAGLERVFLDRVNPYVIKSPLFIDELMEALESRRIQIHAAIIPMRDLFAAAESRRRVCAEAEARGKSGALHPGSLWHTQIPEQQEEELAIQFHKAVFSLMRFDVPVIFPEFPLLVRDPRYLFRKMQPLMEEHGVDQAEFLAAHARASRPDLIHDFRKP
jgi:hypothetical protein